MARLKELNTQSKLGMKQLEEELRSEKEELEGARARIAALEDELAAATTAAAATSTVAAEPISDKSAVSEDRQNAPVSECAAAAQDAAAALRANPFGALADIGLQEAAAQIVAHAGEHGYVIVFGSDSAEGEPSARTQLVENAAAAVTSAGVAVAVVKLDISGAEDGSAFVVVGEDGCQVRFSTECSLVHRSRLFFIRACRLPAPSSPACRSKRRQQQLIQPLSFGCILSATTAP